MVIAADSNLLFTQGSKICSGGILTTIASAQNEEKKGHKPGDEHDRDEGGEEGRQRIRRVLCLANVLVIALHLS